MQLQDEAGRGWTREIFLHPILSELTRTDDLMGCGAVSCSQTHAKSIGVKSPTNGSTMLLSSRANQSEPDTQVTTALTIATAPRDGCGLSCTARVAHVASKPPHKAQANQKRYGCAQRRSAPASPEEFRPTVWLSGVRRQLLAPHRLLMPIPTPRLSPLLECKLLCSAAPPSPRVNIGARPRSAPHRC